ncbi:putative bifunctional diguanylate cyclase/phosphodiesterase [Agaribacterium haliotis]|uniref:putative bifunctional diguanylate cyclase/phosphodiesterase n=1 Tax=Agaribacterium haliotis TaxID=2013869 RepID=UPI000BB55818|nr:bifunctional diguanylate cyclase/phosphodiesterase [Agaribacterium haliotis]
MSAEFSREMQSLLQTHQLSKDALCDSLTELIAEIDSKLQTSREREQAFAAQCRRLDEFNDFAHLHFNTELISMSTGARKLLFTDFEPPAASELGNLGLHSLFELAQKLSPAFQQLRSHIEFARADGKTLWLGVELRLNNDQSYSALLHDDSELRISQARLNYLSQHDEKTGLPNRQRLLQKIESAIARAHRDINYQFSLLLIELKPCQHTLEQHELEHAQVELAKRLHKRVRNEDLCAYMGGWEFAVLLGDSASASATQAWAEQLQQHMSEPLSFAPNKTAFTVLIGASISQKQQQHGEQLLSEARQALEHAEGETSKVRLFDRQLRQRDKLVVETETRLRHALRQERLELHYQPIVDLNSWRTAHCEALLRWRQQNNELSTPGSFIAHAEQSSIMQKLGNWVIDEACEQLCQWQQISGKQHSLSINISATQLLSDDLIPELQAAIKRHRLSPDTLKLELSEQSLLKVYADAKQQLRKLNKLQCELLVDDFGSGFSSMTYLKQLPISTVKIDQRLIAEFDKNDSDSKAIVKAIIALAHNLDLKVIAEGVESRQQLLELEQLGCDMAQGFIFSCAEPADKAEALLNQDWAAILELARPNQKPHNTVLYSLHS